MERLRGARLPVMSAVSINSRPDSPLLSVCMALPVIAGRVEMLDSTKQPPRLLPR